MHWWNGAGHMGWIGFGWIFGVALVAVVIWALVRPGGAPANTRESPEQILKRRYASGEVDRETYERMLSDLKS